MLMYLIHLNNQEKTQYNIEEVHGELKKELLKIIENRKEEEERIEPIIDAIEKGNINTINQLIRYAIKINKIQLIRKYQYILIKFIEEKKNKKNY